MRLTSMIPSKSSAKSDQEEGNLIRNLRSISNLVPILSYQSIGRKSRVSAIHLKTKLRGWPSNPTNSLFEKPQIAGKTDRTVSLNVNVETFQREIRNSLSDLFYLFHSATWQYIFGERRALNIG